jgi:sigma-B regulation protein RsbU (phosphoserine phosphatase)
MDTAPGTNPPDLPAAIAPDPAARAIWRGYVREVALANGATLFRQGDPSDAIYFVADGELRVVLEVDGAGRADLRRFGPGECLGEIGLCRQQARTATVEAASEARLWRLDAADLARLEREHPPLALALHRHVAARLAERVAFSNRELKEPLARLAGALRGFASIDFSDDGWDRAAVTRAAARTDEVGDLARATDFLAHRLREHLAALRLETAAREAIESELRIAGEIQRSLLPPTPAHGPRGAVDFAAHLEPARAAGGDLYDAFFLGDGRLFALVADVAGKGIPAAVFMALTAMAVRAVARETADPGELLARANRLLCERNTTTQFVTALAVALDPSTGRLEWANAGHPPGAIAGPQGAFRWLDGPRAAPLGAFDASTYATGHASLAPGECLVLYSDGATECAAPDGALFGPERIRMTLEAAPPTSSAAAIESLLAAIRNHRGDAPPSDDLTLAAIRLAR